MIWRAAEPMLQSSETYTPLLELRNRPMSMKLLWAISRYRVLPVSLWPTRCT